MRSDWRSAGDLIATVLDRAGITEGFRRHSALSHWDEVVGEKIGRKARPRELRGKTLIVDVESSAWVHELTYLKSEILCDLNRKVGGDAIDRIVFLVGGSVEER